MNAASHLVPSPDMLGLPGPAVLFQALMALTLALHWLFIGASAGGVLALLVTAGKNGRTGGSEGAGEAGGKQQGSDDSGDQADSGSGHASGEADGLPGLRALFIPELPFFLALGMTVGVAPLLFLQVLYGNLFYSAAILHAFWWLGLVPLVIVVFYLMYLAWYRSSSGSSPSRGLLGIILALFVIAALVMSANATLLQTPSAWQSMRCGFQGTRLYLGDRGLPARLVTALAAFAAVGGLVFALLAQYLGEVAQGARLVAWRKGMSLAWMATVFSVLGGLSFLASLPPRLSAVMASGGEGLLVYPAALFMVAAGVLAFHYRSHVSVRGAGAALLAWFLALFATAGLRDYIRRLTVAALFDPGRVPVHPQWYSFGLWAVLFVVGLGVVAYLFRLAYSPVDRPAGVSAGA